MMKQAVLGLGISGRAALHFLGREAIGIDHAQKIESLDLPNRLCDEAHFREPIDLLVISPGIPLSHPICKMAKEVIGEVELAARHTKATLIGVTGTNGKTTVSSLIAHVLGTKCVGNVGDPLIEHVDDEGILVVELSSYQLETMSHKCWNTSLILNLTPDHLERHKSMLAYKKIKLKLAEMTTGITFVNGAIEKMNYNFGQGVTKRAWMDHEMLELISHLEGKGAKEAENLIGAFSVLQQHGISLDTFLQKLATFKKPEHRLEFVKEIDEIWFYNDSKGTNVDSVIFAIEELKGDKILLVGGKDKGLSFAKWNDAFDESIKAVVAFGQAAKSIDRDLDCSVVSTKTMEDALLKAVKLAKSKDKIILSPGCSSFDAYTNFEERGKEFKRLVRNLCREKTSS